jgi:RNA polymerase sigma-70 factor, ECF subfamily
VHSTREIERIYQEHGAALVLFGTSMVGERNVAQDAVHQVFLRLLESGDLARAKDQKAYLFACVRNQLLNDAKVRQRLVPLESDSTWFEPPERDYAAEENLRGALGELIPDQRQVVILHVWGELTFSQIAEVLGISANTAASRYRYGVGKLRESMCSEEKI